MDNFKSTMSNFIFRILHRINIDRDLFQKYENHLNTILRKSIFQQVLSTNLALQILIRQAVLSLPDPQITTSILKILELNMKEKSFLPRRHNQFLRQIPGNIFDLPRIEVPLFLHGWSLWSILVDREKLHRGLFRNGLWNGLCNENRHLHLKVDYFLSLTFNELNKKR